MQINEYKNLEHGKLYFSYKCYANTELPLYLGFKHHDITIYRYHPDYESLHEICKFCFQSSGARVKPYGLKLKYDYSYNGYTFKQFSKFVNSFERFESNSDYISGENYNSDFSKLLRFLKSKKINRITYNENNEIFEVRKR